MAKRKEKVVTAHISMPPEVKRALQLQARKESRSFSQQVTYVLMQYVDGQAAKVAA